jgi:hypothetical protein
MLQFSAQFILSVVSNLRATQLQGISLEKGEKNPKPVRY